MEENILPLQCIVLYVLDATFNFAFMPGRVRFGWNDDYAVMLAGKLYHLWIEIRIEPVGILHRCLEVVYDQCLGNTTNARKEFSKERMKFSVVCRHIGSL